MADISWNVEALECYPQKDGETDVVFNVRWRVTGVDGGFSGVTGGNTAVKVDSSEPFTPYSQLTQDQVIEWVKSVMGDAAVARNETIVLNQIAAQKNPPVITPPLPWQTLEAPAGITTPV